MKKFDIYAGLNGGFGGATYVHTDYYASEDDAIDDAYQYAYEEYESMLGLHGLDSYEDIEKEILEKDDFGFDLDNEIDRDTLAEIVYEEILSRAENWLDYRVELVTDDLDDDEDEDDFE